MSASLLHFLPKGIVKSQSFGSSGTFNVPKGVTFVFVEGSGGGQAGGRGLGSSPFTGGLGGNGARGGLVVVSVTPEAAVTVTIGSGGSEPLGVGGNSSFGSTVFLGASGVGTAKDIGYQGGSGAPNGTSGGSPGQSSLSFEGGAGGTSDGNSSSPGGGGGGGAGHWGSGGAGGTVGTPSGGGGNTSAGGGGSSSASLPGGSGGDGRIVVYWVEPE